MPRQLTVVMAQLNLLVGDIKGNTDRVIIAARQSLQEFDADIVAFPELTLTGYPPEDLLLRPSLKIRIDRALQRLLDENIDIHMIVGYPLHEKGKLYNALSLIKGGGVLATYRKQCLPNYQVFDERRYFASGDCPCVVEIKGVPVAMTICEDMWEEAPTVQAAQAGASLLININASPFHRNKAAERAMLLQTRARQADIPIVYANLVGGQDELVFDGSSMAVTAQGDCLVRAPSFVEGLFPVRFELTDGKAILCPDANGMSQSDSIEEGLYKALVLGVRDYVQKNGFKGVVLGLSGGIDSALTLAIAVDALGADKVQAVMMPFTYTSQMSLDLAQSQAMRLGVHYSVIPISDAYASFTAALADEFKGLSVDVTEQNIQARCRGVLLMAISNKKGHLVLTTGNKSEIAVGYCTLYGDMAGGFDVLKDVPKTMVYRVSVYRNGCPDAVDSPVIPQQVIDRPPTAELAPGQVDQDSLPPYDELDAILELYVEQDCSAAEIIARGYAESTVRRVLRLVDLNEYKRRQSPVGVRLTQRGFGRDRRYPITSAWELGE
ncbi:MAG: NAD+ synthase [Gammaproteobacteria bacterium]|nr:NAD+ synthase [Gammaproteobacteria bacterium]MDP2141900.1 NAD+ synthase [Gammaproteobacteria bacterium]MDP2347218.1 NAD+ synthase [Gammaproteobacteria bacterium]